MRFSHNHSPPWKQQKQSKQIKVYLSSPQELVSNWVSWEYSFQIKLKEKKLWYLLDAIPSKIEDGVEVSHQKTAEGADPFNDLLVGSIHHKNIELIGHTTIPSEMWESLWLTNQGSTSGTRFYYIRQLITAHVVNEPEVITGHLIKMSRIAVQLRKLCPNGTISIDDLGIESMTASLPSSFSMVLSQFK